MININLPHFRPIKLISGVDRYGFSSVLAALCNRSTIPRSFANWIHGWIYYEDPNEESLMMALLPKEVSVIVRNDLERAAMIRAGFTNVRTGGLPFAYINQQNKLRNKNSLLVFPAHSDELTLITGQQNEYLDYLESIKKDFEFVYVSIYYLDIDRFFHKAAEARGLKVIQGARPDDANSMLRTRAMLDSFEYVTTNTTGSHMLYALYAGCKFSFCGPFFSIPENVIASTAKKFGYAENYTARALWFSSEDYLRQRFGKFFVDHPCMGLHDVSFAKDEIGEKYVMSSREIQDALGWTVSGQIIGYASGARRRLSRPFISREWQNKK